MNTRHDMITCFVVRPTADGGSHEFLKLRRSEGQYLGGTWQTVRGGAEPGESYIQAALRELIEETGLTPTKFYRLPLVETFYIPEEDTIWQSVPFCAIVSRDAVIRIDAEHSDFRWVTRERVDAETMWASERTVLASLLRDILDNGPAEPHLRIEI